VFWVRKKTLRKRGRTGCRMQRNFFIRGRRHVVCGGPGSTQKKKCAKPLRTGWDITRSLEKGNRTSPLRNQGKNQHPWSAGWWVGKKKKKNKTNPNYFLPTKKPRSKNFSWALTKIWGSSTEREKPRVSKKKELKSGIDIQMDC